MMNNAISYLGKPFQKIPEAAGQRALAILPTQGL